MQLTIDSSEPLDHVLRVVESLYGVQLSATTNAPVGKPTPSAAGATRRGSQPARTSSKAATPSTAGRRSASRQTAKNDPAIIRSWARANGHTIRDRGRVPATILAAYKRSTKAPR
jgi:hypothetical protein